MVCDTALAFDTLEARSIASAKGQPLDRIAVRDYAKSVEIGAFQSERGVKQGLRFNVVLEVVHPSNAISDDVDAVLSYDTITEAIEAALAAERLNLLETLAERVAARVLRHAEAARVFVRVEKTERGPGSLGVEIVRVRDSKHARNTDVVVRPMVIFLPNIVVESGELLLWLDAIEALDAPTLLCVEPLGAVTSLGLAEPDQRLQLLGIEQAAWILSAKDARCVVAGTRTEIDWAFKNGQMSVWAPSKIVMDAIMQPAGDDPVGLALWIGREFDAMRTVACGEIKDDRLDVVKTPKAL
ncbi:MAG: dihydroneopterin aldolase [Amylibacter sp.]|nr:dihydroneopterin aldolase [Amylibacter sp.]MDG1236239.1 dihydroneopterin aldolase [Amylibacter sp.]